MLQENPDLFKWLTGQAAPPDVLRANPAYSALSAHVMQQLADNSTAEAAASPGTEWVRGWSDGGSRCVVQWCIVA